MSEKWIECETCHGEKGWIGHDNEWHDCPACLGNGGRTEDE